MTPPASSQAFRIGVLASGAGTTLQAVIDACERGAIAVQIAVVISNNSRSGAADRAAKHSIPFEHLSGQTHAEPAVLDTAIRDTLREHRVDLVLLAGYMKKVGSCTLEAFGGRMINTHPSLLPRHGGQGMYGRRVHQAVLEQGDEVTGISVHLLDREYDTGRVLAQAEVPVQAGDDAAALAARVQAREREFLVEVIDRIARGEIELPQRV